jgi:hypothetical protein
MRGIAVSPVEELVPLTQKLLEVPAELVETAIGLELGDGTVVADGLDGRRCVFPAGLHLIRLGISERRNCVHRPRRRQLARAILLPSCLV